MDASLDTTSDEPTMRLKLGDDSQAIQLETVLDVVVEVGGKARHQDTFRPESSPRILDGQLSVIGTKGRALTFGLERGRLKQGLILQEPPQELIPRRKSLSALQKIQVVGEAR